MADMTEVADALVCIIAAALYPNGITKPSPSGVNAKVYQGWPEPGKLQVDLPASIDHVTVFPRPGDKVTFVGAGQWQDGSVNADGSVNTFREIRRQKKDFQITVWASCFDTREPVAKVVDALLATVTQLDLPDCTQGTVRYVGSTQDDNSQRQGIFRRDLFYSVEYSTLEASVAWPIKSHKVNFSPAVAQQPLPTPVPAPVGVITININPV
jgi:hypothetical protein